MDQIELIKGSHYLALEQNSNMPLHLRSGSQIDAGNIARCTRGLHWQHKVSHRSPRHQQLPLYCMATSNDCSMLQHRIYEVRQHPDPN